jgi:hypothetical protein
VVSLHVVGSYSNDVRMTRWPLRFSAYPLLHQVWALNREMFERLVAGRKPGDFGAIWTACRRAVSRSLTLGAMSRDSGVHL